MDHPGPGRLRGRRPEPEAVRRPRPPLIDLPVEDVHRKKGACFAADTPILTPGGWAKVQDLKAGDRVLARSEVGPEGPVEAKEVLDAFSTTARVWHLHAGGRVIATTAEHPLWVRGRGWAAAWEVRPGDSLAGHDGRWVRVDAVVDTGEHARVYNVRVADHQTYFVGCEAWGFGVWEHNACIVLYRYPAPGQPDETKHWSIRVTTNNQLTNHTHLVLDAFPRDVGSLRDWLAWHADARIERAGSGRGAEASKQLPVDDALAQLAYAYAETRLTSGSFKYDLAGRSCITYVAQVLNKAGYNLPIPAKGDQVGMGVLIAALNALVQ